jgi:hypothetical protein
MTEQWPNLVQGSGHWLKATAIIISNPSVRSLLDRCLQPDFSYQLIRMVACLGLLVHNSADQGRCSVCEL